MKRLFLLFFGTTLTVAVLLFTSCDMPTALDNNEPIAHEDVTATALLDDAAVTHAASAHAKRANVDHVAGVVWAKWGECEGGGDQGGGHEDGGHEDGSHEVGSHEDGEHEDSECTTRRPAREFSLRVTAHDTDPARGTVLLQGTGEYEDVWFSGPVTWYAQGETSNEAFFGGPVDNESPVGDGCFLVGVQDNSPRPGPSKTPDRIHYKIKGSAHSSCHVPDHFPLRFPAEAYRGDVQVHTVQGPPSLP